MSSDELEKEIGNIIKPSPNQEWLERYIGRAAFEYDATALQKSLNEPLSEFLAAGGKRWRPRLMRLAAQAVGGDVPLQLLLVPELMHNGSLIVDDIEDGSKLRRGKPAMHVVRGVDIAVNAGNFLYYLPLKLIMQSSLSADIKKRLYEEAITMMVALHAGQATDIAWHHGFGEPTVARYLQMCRDKTGAMAAMSARFGAIIGGGSDKQVEAFGRFALDFGVAFQIKDDIMNLEGGLGKELAEDIAEGKRTLCVLYALETSPQRQRLLEILDLKEPRAMEAVAIIRDSGAIEKSRQKMGEFAQRAWRHLDAAITDSPAKQELRELVEKLSA